MQLICMLLSLNILFVFLCGGSGASLGCHCLLGPDVLCLESKLAPAERLNCSFPSFPIFDSTYMNAILFIASCFGNLTGLEGGLQDLSDKASKLFKAETERFY